MKFSRHSDDIHGHIIDAAAEWFIEFNADEPDAQTRRNFDSWLRKSPEHLRAYLEMFPLWDDASRVDRERNLTADTLIRLARGESQNLIPLPSNRVSKIPKEAREQLNVHRWLRVKSIAIAASIIVVIVGAALYRERNVYSTGIGEQRVIALGEGSSIELNARSKLRVEISDTERRVELLEGQALFRVTKDATRPFIVANSDTRVRVLGTQFDVHKKHSGTVVTVLEGRVVVSPASHMNSNRTEAIPSHDVSTSGPRTPQQPMEMLLGAGEQAIVTPVAIRRPSRPDPGAATAWLQHRLIFSATPLHEVANEFNRYNERQIIIKNAAKIDFEVSGAFSMTDLPSLLRFLRAQPNVVIEEGGKDIIVTLN